MPTFLSGILTGILMFGSNHAPAADVLVDNFDDTDIVTPGTRQWGGTATWRNVPNFIASQDAWKMGAASGTNKFRSISDTSIGINDAYFGSVEGGSIRYNGSLSSDGGGVTFSEAATASRAFQQLTAQVLRETADFDATTKTYIRFTAWYDDASTNAPATNPSKPATFAISFSQEPQPGSIFGFDHPQPAKNVIGPHDPLSDELVGISLTNVPQAFVLNIKDNTLFKVNPNYETFTMDLWNNNGGIPAVTSLALDDWSDIRTLGFSVNVIGAAAQTGSLQASFAVDDIMFLENLPGVAYSVDPLVIAEGASGFIDINLKALPSHDVTLNFTNTAQLSFSPSSLTFTPANHLTTQQLTVTSITSGTIVSNTPVGIVPGTTTSDVWYGNNTLETMNVTIGPAPSSVRDWMLLDN